MAVGPESIKSDEAQPRDSRPSASKRTAGALDGPAEEGGAVVDAVSPGEGVEEGLELGEIARPESL